MTYLYSRAESFNRTALNDISTTIRIKIKGYQFFGDICNIQNDFYPIIKVAVLDNKVSRRPILQRSL